MSIIHSDKRISASQIPCDGTLKVTISLTAKPDIQDHPADVVLVLDRSRSMAGAPLASMKAGAKTFIDILAESTGGSQDGQIGGGSRIAVVSFASTATKDTQLITSVAALKAAVDSLTAAGSTNHADAFTKAGELFDPGSSAQKIIVLFTDGKTTIGPPPAPVAAALRDSGVVIYCIGLTGSDGIDVATLHEWATDPDSEHVAVTPDPAELEELFADIAQSISKPGATGIVVDEVVHSDFQITSILTPQKGDATLMGPNTIRWTIEELGATDVETATLEFYVRHIGETGGTKPVNQSITYTDREKQDVSFPDPKVLVDCGVVTTPEGCPEPVEVTMDGCQDFVSVDLGDTYLQSQGRILEVRATLHNVCPDKRVALAVLLSEVDEKGKEHPRGMKTVTVPVHHCPACRNVLVRGIRFILPEDLNVSGTPGKLCTPRNLRVRLFSHYVDYDFQCCNVTVTCKQ
ncbi:von Willebrand factor type A [Firmicutes bacterium CAG:137]|jgi:Ca-activated chloride channel family protein|nr:von Willebrand factor type A [Firmicutes bacterium CAG:137]